MPKKKYFSEEERKAAKKAGNKRYRQSAKGKIAKARSDKKYKQSEKGKIAVKKSGLKYRATEHGKATTTRANKKYIRSEKGKAAHRRFALKNDYKYQRRWKKTEAGKRSNNLAKKRRLIKYPQARLIATQRSRISQVLNSKNSPKKLSTLKYIGCTAIELAAHLEKQFKPGMNWNNYGRDGWEVDHIRPLSSFDLTLEEEKKAAFHFLNQRPEWREDNIKKSDNIIMLKADPNFSQIIFKKLYPSSSKLKDLDDDIKKILKKKDPDLEIGLTVYKKRNGTFQAIVLTPKLN